MKNWAKLMPEYREQQAEAYARLMELDKGWKPTVFEKIAKTGNFHGSEECGVCGHRWREEGEHKCDLASLYRKRSEYAEAHEAWLKGRQLGYDVVSEGHKRYEALSKAIRNMIDVG